MKVCVQFVTGETKDVECDPGDTMETVKAKALTQIGCGDDAYGYRVITQTSSPAEHLATAGEIPEGGTVMLLPRMRMGEESSGRTNFQVAAPPQSTNTH